LIAFLRITGMVAAAGVVWVVVASQVPGHTRLSIAGVVPGAVVSQPFGCTSLELEPYDPFCPGRHIHTGIDLAAPMGRPVLAAAAGTARVGFDPNGAGLYILVVVDAHARVFYCHLSSVGVADRQAVSAGQVIGAIGQSGLATGPHLHFEVQIDGSAVDPVAWLAS
jgi:murein DD-endopeptidase MepM/ murein hydrolase activator NlpD